MTYDYECNTCGCKFIITKSMNEEIELICPICGGKDVKRIFSVPTFKVKCNGFVGKINK